MNRKLFVMALCGLLPCAASAQAVVNALAAPAPRPAPVTVYAPTTPPDATTAPQIDPKYRRVMGDIEFLPNETNEDYVKRMTKRREGAQAALSEASKAHSDAMRALRAKFSIPAR